MIDRLRVPGLFPTNVIFAGRSLLVCEGQTGAIWKLEVGEEGVPSYSQKIWQQAMKRHQALDERQGPQREIQISSAPAVPGGSFEEEAADRSRRRTTNEHELDTNETRIDTKTDGIPSTTSGANMLLRHGSLAVTISWDEDPLGARASRPHRAWHNFTCLTHFHQPGTV